MMELVEANEHILRQKAKEISKFDQEVSDLVGQLFIKLESLEGVGLAAPQVGNPLKIAVIEYTRKEDDDKEINDIPKTVLINPQVIWCSKDRDTKMEACFSLPKVEVEVPRNKKIHIKYQDELGKRKKMKAKGFLARAIQHEIDHLNGVLITDYK